VITSGGEAVDIPVPPGQSPLAVVAAIMRVLVEKKGAEVIEAQDLIDGTICIDLRVPAGLVGEGGVPGEPASV